MTGESIISLLDIQLSLAMCTLFVPLTMGVFGKPLGQLSGYLPMLLGGAAWSLREVFQRFVVPISALEELQAKDPAQFAQMQYPQYVAEQLAGNAFKLPAEWYASVPADIQGLVASFLAYFLAQQLIRMGWGHRTQPGENVVPAEVGP